ncbi:Decarboxylase yanB [Colletotrichum trifolii]|uniref:6-methylsalicylate decarboxylase n=1 Tax=Colletotrichum trifolii TaxID=5466 RepID=A0A4R8QJP8_COLTR|nr:Decarboxylase yanB [Colletotrichum trifolii]
MGRPSLSRICLLASVLSATSADSSRAKIDTHAHYLPDFYAQALRDAGHVPGPDGMPGIPAWDPETHIDFMNNQSITKSYLSISSPGVYLTPPSKPATENATNLARAVNTYASQLKAKYPERFGFFASLPLPDIKAAVDEIDHAFRVLDPKPDGVVLMSNYYGTYLGDPALDPVYQALDALNVTIFEHPTTPCTEANRRRFSIDAAEPVELTQQEWQALNRPVAARQRRAPNLDFPFDTARTFADLFYSHVPKRFPNMRWIIPHAGGGLIPTLDRVVANSLPEQNITYDGVRATLQRSFYFDLAGPWPVEFAIPPLLRWVGHDKIVYGSDTPFTPWALAKNTTDALDRDLDELFTESHEADSVRRDNAKTLFC